MAWVTQSWGGINTDHVVRYSVRDGGARVIVYLDTPVGTDAPPIPGASDDPLAHFVIYVDGDDARAFLEAVTAG